MAGAGIIGRDRAFALRFARPLARGTLASSVTPLALGRIGGGGSVFGSRPPTRRRTP